MKQIKLSDKQGNQNAPLSKEQKRFNNYVQKIKNLKIKIDESKEISQFLLEKGQELIIPLDKKLEECVVNTMLALESSPFIKDLHANAKKKLKKIILEYAENVVFTLAKVEYQPIFDKYSQEGFEEVKERQISDDKESMKSILNLLGIDITDKDMETPESFFQKVHEVEAEMLREAAAEEAEAAEKWARRKKTKAQIEKAAREAQAAETLKKTTKQIYRDLVQNFHPDREQDEVKRVEKTQIMQQITTAYEANDFLKLLELQINLLEDRENAFGKFDDTQLKYFNNVLKEQIQELETEMAEEDPTQNGHPFGYLAYHFYSKDFVLFAVQQQVSKQEKELKVAEKQLNSLQTLEGLKRFIQAYKSEKPKMDFNFMKLIKFNK